MADPADEYCSYDDVANRLTRDGYLYVADRDDQSGSGPAEVSETERDRYILSSIEYAGGIIDMAVDPMYRIGTARGSGNKWLRDRARDIATYMAITNGGEEASEDYRTLYQQSVDWLEQVRLGTRKVPGLRVETPNNGTSRGIGVPRVANPRRGRRGRRRGCGGCN